MKSYKIQIGQMVLGSLVENENGYHVYLYEHHTDRQLETVQKAVDYILGLLPLPVGPYVIFSEVKL